MKLRERDFWIWAEALELLQNAERLQHRFSILDPLQSIPCWGPPIDIYEQDGELTLIVALPGVSQDQVEVVVDGSGLIIRGRRPLSSVMARAAIHRLEIPYGRFERRIILPGGEFRLENQSFEDGCLILVLRFLE